MPMDQDLPQDVADKLTEQFGEFVVVPTKSGPAAFRVATLPEFQRYQALIVDEKTRSKASEIFARQCCVYPDAKGFDAMLVKYPGIISGCANACLELSGFEAEPQVKKFVRGSALT